MLTTGIGPLAWAVLARLTPRLDLENPLASFVVLGTGKAAVVPDRLAWWAGATRSPQIPCTVRADSASLPSKWHSRIGVPEIARRDPS